jgi:hypothetical protein
MGLSRVWKFTRVSHYFGIRKHNSISESWLRTILGTGEARPSAGYKSIGRSGETEMRLAWSVPETNLAAILAITVIMWIAPIGASPPGRHYRRCHLTLASIGV